MTTLTTPSGMPASRARLGEHQRGQRRDLGRLEHDRVAGGDGRAGSSSRPSAAGSSTGRSSRRRRSASRRIDRRVVGGVLAGRLALEVARGAGEERDVVDGAGHVELGGEPDRLAGLRGSRSARARRPARRAAPRAGQRARCARPGWRPTSPGKAARAAATAASTSAAPASATCLDGLARWRGRRPAMDLTRCAPSRRRPAMNWCTRPSSSAATTGRPARRWRSWQSRPASDK